MDIEISNNGVIEDVVKTTSNVGNETVKSIENIIGTMQKNKNILIIAGAGLALWYFASQGKMINSKKK